MSVLTTGSKCRLCDKVFRGPEEELGGALIVGEKPAERVGRYIGKLIQHLQQKHPEEAGYYALQSQEYLGLICLMNYETTDELVRLERDRMRWLIHKATRRVKVTDERIEERVTQAIETAFAKAAKADALPEQLAAFIHSEVAATMKQMRDVFEERGLYPENLPPTTATAQANTAPGPLPN